MNFLHQKPILLAKIGICGRSVIIDRVPTDKNFTQLYKLTLGIGVVWNYFPDCI